MSQNSICDIILSEVHNKTQIFIPPRLYVAMGYNLELIDPLALNKLDRDIKGSIAFALGNLFGEADALAVNVITKWLNLRGRNAILEVLGDVKESAYMLFYMSLDFEPLIDYFGPNSKVTLEEAVKCSVRLAKKLEENLNNLDEKSRVYVSLHLSRFYAELARLAYSLQNRRKELIKLLSDTLCKEYSGDSLHKCILEKHAFSRADYQSRGKYKDLASLGYIQITSTVTRTDLYEIKEILRKVKEKMDNIVKEIVKKDPSILIGLDALSLVGSYYYNYGWLTAVEKYPKDPKGFGEASESFLESAKQFVTVGNIPLGYIRGSYVALWNYYLMRINSDIVGKGRPSDETLKDAVCWAKLFEDTVLDESKKFLSYNIGRHGFYAHTLGSVAQAILENRGVKTDSLKGIDEYYPPSIKHKRDLALRIVKDAVPDNLSVLRHSVARLIKDIKACKVEGGVKDYIGGLTIRERPLLEAILSVAEKGSCRSDIDLLKELLALLVVYTI